MLKNSSIKLPLVFIVGLAVGMGVMDKDNQKPQRITDEQIKKIAEFPVQRLIDNNQNRIKFWEYHARNTKDKTYKEICLRTAERERQLGMHYNTTLKGIKYNFESGGLKSEYRRKVLKEDSNY